MKAIVWVCPLQPVPPSDVRMLGVDQDAVLITGTISSDACKWLIEKAERLYRENQQRVAFLDIFGDDAKTRMSQTQLIFINENDFLSLAKIRKLALEQPESIPNDGKIPQDLFDVIKRIMREGQETRSVYGDQISNRAESIKNALTAEQILQQEREGELIFDAYGQCGLAISMWRMGIQLKGWNKYVILVYKDGKLQLNNIELGSVPMNNARDAFKHLFGANPWIEVKAERPRGSFKELFTGVIDVLNPKHISLRAIIPGEEDPYFYPCLERNGDFLRIGLMFPEGPRLARLKMDEHYANETAEALVYISKSFLGTAPQKSTADLPSLEAIYATATTKNLGISKNRERLYGMG